MGACFLHTTGLVVAGYGKPQGIHGEHTTILIAEKIIVCLASADGHILPQNRHHHRAEGDGLDFAVLVVAENDLPCV